MSIVMGLDQHRAQITGEWIDTEELKGALAEAPARVRGWATGPTDPSSRRRGVLDTVVLVGSFRLVVRGSRSVESPARECGLGSHGSRHERPRTLSPDSNEQVS